MAQPEWKREWGKCNGVPHEEVRAMYKSGVSVAELAERLKVQERIILRVLEEPTRKKGQYCGQLTREEVEKYLKQGLTQNLISIRAGVTPGAIGLFIQRHLKPKSKRKSA